MAEYLAPGVFVEEVSFRAKSIEGVGTSVAAVVGPTRYGPLRGKPEVVTSFEEFGRTYGDAMDLDIPSDNVLNHTAIAAKAFFDGGGKQLFVSRVVRNVNATDAGGAGGGAEFGTAASPDGDVRFDARFPGAMGNFWLEFFWRDSENLLKQEVTSAPADDELVFLRATGVTSSVLAPGVTVPPAAFPLEVEALVRRSGNRYVIHQNRARIQTADDSAISAGAFREDDEDADAEGVLLAAGLVNGGGTSATFTRVFAKPPTSGPLADGTFAVLTLSAQTNLSTFTGAAHWGTLTTLRGSLNEEGDVFIVDGDGLNAGVGADIALPLAALAAASTVRAVMVQRNFDVAVRLRRADGQPGE